MTFRGIVIAEGLEDPTLVNALRVLRAEITEDDHPVDYQGTLGRRACTGSTSTTMRLRGSSEARSPAWYSHFWDGDRLLVVYNDAQFEVSRRDRSSWARAIEHGQRQGIPIDELDFVSDE
jgi:hypothetical protein